MPSTILLCRNLELTVLPGTVYQLEKATSENLPAGSEDLALNLEICDQIRSKQVSPKDAAQALKRRIGHKNPNVQLLALGVRGRCSFDGGSLEENGNLSSTVLLTSLSTFITFTSS